MVPGAVPLALLISPRWGLPGRYTGYINIAPLGLARGGAPRIFVSQKVCSHLEYIYKSSVSYNYFQRGEHFGKPLHSVRRGESAYSPKLFF